MGDITQKWYYQLLPSMCLTTPMDVTIYTAFLETGILYQNTKNPCSVHIKKNTLTTRMHIV